MTTQPAEGATPGLQLHLVDSDDEPLDEAAGGTRRPSTASLSRFRSCPQLSSADGHVQDSPGSDDYGLGAELCVSNVHFTLGSSRAHQRLHLHEPVHGDGPSQTPTPPSTPGSKRSHVSLKETLSSGARGAAVATPKAVGRTRLEHALHGRASSTDSPAFPPLEDNNLRTEEYGSERGSRQMSDFFDEPPDLSLDGRLSATEDGASTPMGGQRSFHADEDSMDKCARWLQTLKMTSGDRLKSRSHIQLPPI